MRAKFLKREPNKIYDLLNVSYEYADCARLEDNNRFVTIFELLMEITDIKQTAEIYEVT